MTQFMTAAEQVEHGHRIAWRTDVCRVLKEQTH